MATLLVYSGATFVTGLTWADAYQTLKAATDVATATDVIWVAADHSESSAASQAITLPTTPELQILCVTRDGAAGNSGLAATAVIVTTTSNALSFVSGFGYIYGLLLTCGSSTNANNFGILTSTTVTGHLVFDTCSLILGSSNAANRTIFCALGSGTTSQMVELVNTKVKFAGVGQALRAQGPVIWRDGTAIDGAGSTPTSLWKPTGGSGSVVNMSGLDTDLATDITNLVDLASNGSIYLNVRNCKLGASVALKTGSWAGPQQGRITMRNSDSADTHDRLAISDYAGDITHETTIVRTGGASNGIRTIAHKMVSTANSKFWAPLYGPDIITWLASTGSKTISVEIVNDGTTFQDDEVWLEVEGLNTSGFPITTRTSDRMANILSTPANQTSSSDTWDTTGLASPVYQTLSVTFTTAEIGLIRARVVLAEPSKTLYYDPKLVVA